MTGNLVEEGVEAERWSDAPCDATNRASTAQDGSDNQLFTRARGARASSPLRYASTQWTTSLSPKVNFPAEINFKTVFGMDLAT